MLMYSLSCKPFLLNPLTAAGLASSTTLSAGRWSQVVTLTMLMFCLASQSFHAEPLSCSRLILCDRALSKWYVGPEKRTAHIGSHSTNRCRQSPPALKGTFPQTWLVSKLGPSDLYLKFQILARKRTVTGSSQILFLNVKENQKFILSDLLLAAAIVLSLSK